MTATRAVLLVGALGLAPAGACHGGEASHALGGHDHDAAGTRGHGHVAQPAPFGFNLTDHWLDPWVHWHRSPLGAPLLHHFGFEPAFLGKELFVTYGWGEFDEGEEHEVEIELEWAFTRRLGVVLEVPYAWDRPVGEAAVDGLGDLAVVPRAVLAETERFVASANLEIGIPTGSSRVGAGEQWSLAPFLATWFDLGDWWALSSATGLEFGLDSNETEFFCSLGVSKAMRIHDARRFGAEPPHDHGHGLPAGLLAFIGEVYLEGVVDGEADEENVFALEALVGISYTVGDLFDVRAGYTFPLNGNSELDRGVRAGVIHHF
ncbi:MAG: hypothetical protein HKN82_16355 [Akkermansiaceae bacterium]|nr:hypothetical protein [Akkermansiaceae bacterium]